MVNTINFMISPQELQSHIQNDHNVIIIDVRDFTDYHKGHIPNAIHIPEIFTYLPQGLSTQKAKDEFIHFFQTIFSNAGISKNEIVIFYEEKYTLKSPRGLTILKYLGYDEKKIKILDGGYHLWFHENLPISTKQVFTIKKEFEVNIDTNLFVDYNEMLHIIEDDSIIVLDVRDKDEWMGISSSPYGINFAPKKGRLPNAIWIEWYNFVTDDMLSVKSLDKIQRELDKKNIKYNDHLVLYCFKGARLSNSYIALRKLGFENIRIYFAGWNEWCRKENAPIINEIENVDNPILQENIILKQNLDALNLQYASLIDFNRYNKEALFAFNRDGEICSANDATYEKLPHIRHYKDIYPNYTVNEIFNMIDNNQEKNLTIEKNGRYFSLQLRGSKDTNKIIVHTFETTEIYTLNKTLDEKIKEAEHSKEMFSLLFDIAPILIDAFDRDGKCILWNKECEKIFGWTIDDINNSKNPMELFYPDEDTQKKAKNTILYKKEKIFRQWHPVDKNGDILTLMWAHIYLPNGEIINIGYDLTKIKQNEKLLYEQSKLASMGEMIGNIAHQWRQPLSAISTAATGMQLQQEYDCLDPKDLISACEAINDNAQYLSNTIEDFTNFIKGNKEKTFFHLKTAIQSVVHLLDGTIKQNNITLILNIKDIELNSYENELTQAMINIINNAKDALVDLPNDTEKIIEIFTYIAKNNCVIHIKDNAGGIQEDILTKIFDPYFSTKHKSQGTGLGLHMTYKLVVEGLQGTVVAKNVSTIYKTKKYKGAEFTITIPIN